MPINQGYEQFRGKRMGWYRWGSHGKKYHYTPGNERARKRAKNKAQKQAAAAHANGYNG